MVRLYYNGSDDSDGYVWSVDTGHGTNEITARTVSLLSQLPMFTETDLKAPNPDKQPRAWIVIPQGRIVRGADGVVFVK